jgi:hypothetical protein
LSARLESWSRPVEPAGAALAVAVALVVFLGVWTLLHHAFYARDQIVDTPVYERYGDAIAEGGAPYRDFGIEYPPGALPVFVLPSLGQTGDEDAFADRFELLMWVCGGAAIAFLGAALLALHAGRDRLLAALAFAALAPLALGSVVLSRFDLWPAALTVGALAALLAGRLRIGHAVLGLAAATKVYPIVLLPLTLAYAWRRGGWREACAGAAAFAGALLVVLVPFLALSPGGVWDSLVRQATRPLQIESLGSSLLLAAHHLFGLGLTMRSSHGSQNLDGVLPDVVGGVQSAVQIGALLLIWIAFARGPADRERLVAACAAAVCAFVVLGRVFSPQYLVWLVLLVPLVGGRRGLLASALLGLALVLTQLWFPYRYWGLALAFDGTASALVLVRDVVVLVLLAVLVWRGREDVLRV